MGNKLNPCDRAELACAHALGTLPPAEAPEVEAHVAACSDCQREVDRLRPAVARLTGRLIDVLSPRRQLQERLALRIAGTTRDQAVMPPPPQWSEPAWEQVAPGIECKLLAADPGRQRVSMLVRLAPGASYPPHTHADIEELHLLDGELWIEARKLLPGDFNRGAPGAHDDHVWTATGCTCVLISSTMDILR